MVIITICGIAAIALIGMLIREDCAHIVRTDPGQFGPTKGRTAPTLY